MAPDSHAESSSRIKVVRDSTRPGPSSRARTGQSSRSGGERKINEFGERVRESVLQGRVVEGIGERLEGAVRDRVREVLRNRFARDLRRALRDVALAKADPAVVSDLLSDDLSDAIEDRVVDALREHLGSALRE